MLLVDCVVGNWSTWGLCSQSCGGGLQGRGRDVIVHSDHGGDPCPSDLAETQYCNNEDCPKGETDWLSWWHILIVLCRGCSWTWSSLGNKFFWKTPGKECFVWWERSQHSARSKLLACWKRENRRTGLCHESLKFKEEDCRCQDKEHLQCRQRSLGCQGIPDRGISIERARYVISSSSRNQPNLDSWDTERGRKLDCSPPWNPQNEKPRSVQASTGNILLRSDNRTPLPLVPSQQLPWPRRRTPILCTHPPIRWDLRWINVTYTFDEQAIFKIR